MTHADDILHDILQEMRGLRHELRQLRLHLGDPGADEGPERHHVRGDDRRPGGRPGPGRHGFDIPSELRDLIAGSGRGSGFRDGGSLRDLLAMLEDVMGGASERVGGGDGERRHHERHPAGFARGEDDIEDDPHDEGLDQDFAADESAGGRTVNGVDISQLIEDALRTRKRCGQDSTDSDSPEDSGGDDDSDDGEGR